MRQIPALTDTETDMAYSRQWSGKVVGHFISLSFSDNKITLHSPNCPGTHSVDQLGLELSPPASASQVLGLKVWATAQLGSISIIQDAVSPVSHSQQAAREREKL